MVNGDLIKGEFLGDIGLVRSNYHDIVMGYPLSTEEVWDLEFGIRDELESKGYGIINYCNFPLRIDKCYIGHFNSINGEKGKIRKLFKVLMEYFDCFYREDYERLSEAWIVFPKNVTCELFYVLDKVGCGY